MTRPSVCALTGKMITAGDVLIAVGDDRYVGVKAGAWRRLRPEQKAALKAEWEREGEAAAVPVETVEPEPLDSYESMTVDELQALADERRVDVGSRRRKQDYVSALRVADVRAQFAAEATGEAGDTATGNGE